MEVKQACPLIEEQTYLFPNIIKVICNNEKDNIEIIKNELVSVKQEADEEFNKVNMEKLTINIKEELKEDTPTKKVGCDIIDRITNTSIKQESNSYVDVVLEGRSSSFQRECNMFPKNKFKDRSKLIKLNGSSVVGKKIKEQDHSTGIIICPICGNVYIKKLEFFHHISTNHCLIREKFHRTELNKKYRNRRKIIHTTDLSKEETKLAEDKLKEWLNFTDNFKSRSEKIGCNCSSAGKNRFKCEVCLKLDPYKNSLTVEKQFKCDICLKSFLRKASLKKHLRNHMGYKPFKCDICWKSFGQKFTLKSHIRCHTGEKPHKCDVCFKSFIHKGELNTHYRCHTLEKPFKCEVCLKSFSWRANLNKHKRCHTGEKPFKCDICLKSYSEKSNLTKHIRGHSGEKPFKCDICENTFSRKGNLTKHLRLHSGRNPFKCDICENTYSVKGNLTKHLRVHTGEKPFKCDTCFKSFAQKYHLNVHLNTHLNIRSRDAISK